MRSVSIFHRAARRRLEAGFCLTRFTATHHLVLHGSDHIRCTVKSGPDAPLCFHAEIIAMTSVKCPFKVQGKPRGMWSDTSPLGLEQKVVGNFSPTNQRPVLEFRFWDRSPFGPSSQAVVLHFKSTPVPLYVLPLPNSHFLELGDRCDC